MHCSPSSRRSDRKRKRKRKRKRRGRARQEVAYAYTYAYERFDSGFTIVAGVSDPDDQPTAAEGPPGVGARRNELLGVDVGGYVIEAEIGRGGMGVVYSASHPVIGKRAAIKVLGREASNNPAAVERFVQEARAVNQIGHPNIVDIFAFGKLPDGRNYLVMDLLEGESLRKRIKRGPLAVAAATVVIDEIAVALMAAHAKGFIHRDLKPDNVMVVAHPARIEIKLLDFGLAKLKAVDSIRAYRTATGAQLGTPDYMSPEQLRGSGNVDPRTDIYALGVMAFELLTGERPEIHDNVLADAHVLSHVPGVTPELAELVKTMLAPDPDRRPSLAAVRAVIKRSTSGESGVRALGTPPALESLTASLVGAKPLLPALPAPAAAQPRARVPSRTPATKLGVPPPPERASARHGVQSSTPEKPRASVPVWLIVVLIVALGAAAALGFVLAS